MLKQKKSGFTLIEMIIVVALVTVALGIVSSIFITGNKVFSGSDVKSTLQIEGQVVQEQLSNVSMQASDIEQVTLKDGSIKKGVQIQEINTLSDIKEIVINLRNDDDMSKKPYTFTFSEDNKELVMKDNNNVERTLSNNVKAFKIMPNGNIGGKFEVDLERERGFSGSILYPVNVDVTFRNRNAVS